MFYRFREALARFMYGRYGSDQLNRFLIVIFFVVFIANIFARNRVRTRMESGGFTLRHEIELGRKPHPAVLMLWEQGDRQVMVLLRRLELNRTECLEGEVQDGK